MRRRDKLTLVILIDWTISYGCSFLHLKYHRKVNFNNFVFHKLVSEKRTIKIFFLTKFSGNTTILQKIRFPGYYLKISSILVFQSMWKWNVLDMELEAAVLLYTLYWKLLEIIKNLNQFNNGGFHLPNNRKALREW